MNIFISVKLIETYIYKKHYCKFLNYRCHCSVIKWSTETALFIHAVISTYSISRSGTLPTNNKSFIQMASKWNAWHSRSFVILEAQISTGPENCLHCLNEICIRHKKIIPSCWCWPNTLSRNPQSQIISLLNSATLKTAVLLSPFL